MDDDYLLHYSRQILLPQIGIEGQQKISASSVFILGLGGLGSSAALYLAAAGVGKLVLNDFDVVERSNLQRQIVHDFSSLGNNKAHSAAARLKALNPNLELEIVSHKLSESEFLDIALQSDLLLDCSDNFATRYLFNRVSIQAAKPLISASAIRTEGQISVFNLTPTSPCYQCLYQDDQAPEANQCSENGVLAPIVGVLGSLQANEALKLITGSGECLDGRLFLLDGNSMLTRMIKISKDPACPACHG